MTSLKDTLVGNLLFSKSVSFDPVRVDGRRIVAGYANIADVVDSQNEKLTREALDKAWAKFSSNPKFAMMQLFHTNIPIANVLFDPIIDASGVTHKSGVDERGLYIVGEVRSDIKIADEVWDKIQKGQIRGFSIGGEYLSQPTTECVNGSCHNVVNDIELHEVSIVDKPANRVSLFNILKDDSLSKLGEMTSEFEDMIMVNNAVEVSKRPYSDGKYGMYFSVPMTVKDGKVFNVPDGFKLVAEKCPNNEWVGLYDLALLRPYSVKGEDITGSAPGGFKGAPLLDKPSEKKDSTLETKNVENIVDPKVDEQPRQIPNTAPPVEEKKPLTLEILAADFARFADRLNSIEGLLLSAKSKSKDEDEEDKEKKKPKDEEGECSKIEKSEKPTVTTPAVVVTTTNPATATVTASAPVETPKVEVKPTVVETPPPPKVEEVKAPEPVKQVVQEVVISQTPPPVAEAKVVVRGQVVPKQDVEPGKVDLLRLYRTPWDRLSGDE